MRIFIARRRLRKPSSLHYAGKPPSPSTQADAERQKRLQAINLIFGMWQDRDDITDGVQYQEELRAEWERD